MKRQALIKLRESVEADNQEAVRFCVAGLIDLEGKAFKPEYLRIGCMMEGSLDAAVAFLEAVLPDWDYSIYTEKSKHAEVIVSNSKDSTDYSEGFDLIPARALLLATIEALISGESDGVK